MQLVRAEVEQCFEVTYDAPGLAVAMTILDLTPSLPVVVSGPSAMDNPIGNTYFGKFTPQIGKSYLVFKAVYTDGSFATLDSDHSHSSETIYAEKSSAGAGSVDLVGVVDDADAIYATVEDQSGLEASVADADEII